MTTAPIRRLPDWTARLAGVIRAGEDAPFAWGTFDCCLAAADAMLATTGVDAAHVVVDDVRSAVRPRAATPTALRHGRTEF